MRVPLLIAALFLCGSIRAACDGLRLPPPVFSFRDEEVSLYRRLVETIRTETDRSPDTGAVVAGFAGCLNRVRSIDDRPAELQWLDRLTVEDNAIEVDGARIDLTRGRDRPLWRIAAALSRDLLRHVPPDQHDLARRLVWHLWVEGLVDSLGNRYNHYIYASELDLEAGVDRGRVFTVGFDVRREGDRLVVAEVLDDRLRARGVVEGAVLVLLDNRSVEGLDYRDLIRFWYSLEPFDYRARLSTGGATLDIAAAAVPRRLSTLTSARRNAVGYVRIDHFAEETVIELRRALHQLRDTQALIIDLRGNGGGRLSVELIDMFFKTGENLVSYRKIGEDGELSHLTGTVEYHAQRLVLLVDRDTASMSELFAAAVHQHDRGLLVGETTSGKGVSQTLLPIGEEGKLCLVQVQYFYPGTERTWHEVGIAPDVRVDVTDEQRRELAERIGAPVVDLEAQLRVDPVLREALRLLEESP